MEHVARSLVDGTSALSKLIVSSLLDTGGLVVGVSAVVEIVRVVVKDIILGGNSEAHKTVSDRFKAGLPTIMRLAGIMYFAYQVHLAGQLLTKDVLDTKPPVVTLPLAWIKKIEAINTKKV